MARLRGSGAMKAMIDQGVPAADLVMLAELVARGRFASARGRYDEAIDFYRQAIEIEARLPYQEPTYWYYPVKQSLGAALFQARRYSDASDAFRGALAQTPNNGWALYGLSRSEAAQGHKREAAAADRALSKAWLGNKRWLRMDRL